MQATFSFEKKKKQRSCSERLVIFRENNNVRFEKVYSLHTLEERLVYFSGKSTSFF